MAKDEFDGVGGSYLIDPKTGDRVLIERTSEASEIVKNAADETASNEMKGESDATIN